MRRGFLITAIVAFASASCGSSKVASTPDPWADVLRMTTIPDTNSDPRVVEVSLEAKNAEWEIAPGQSVHAMTFNGSVPGPVIEAHVGDTLIVHFVNHLDEPTTIHWHGVRVPANMDGSPSAQMPVPPGGTFDYQFPLLDAGTFWYHPHVNESVQMEHGMYGALIVRGDNEPRSDFEGVVMLDDLTLGMDGQIAPPDGVLEDHTGREGPISLLNGRTNLVIPIRAGERQRWRIVNAGSARFYRFAIANQKLTVLGTDGGPVSTPYDTDELFMVPGDRMDVLITASGAPGSRAVIQNLPYLRGHGGGITEAMDLAAIEYNGDEALPKSEPPKPGTEIAHIATDGITPRIITFDEQIDMTTGETTFLIDGQSYPNVPSFDAHVGVTEVWNLVNNSGMDHPFHLHGFFFQVVSRNGMPESSPTWEDTIDLHGHDTLRIAFTPDNRPGMWMYHCHILEHVAHGMMADFHVMP